MGHVHINGYAVPVSHGYQTGFTEVLGHRAYSPNAKYQFRRNGIGRSWRFTTKMLPIDEAQCLMSLINMRGDHWRYDVATANRPVSVTESDFYSDKRRAVLTLLNDEEWSRKMSDRKIAKHCGVSNCFVSNLRKERGVNGSHPAAADGNNAPTDTSAGRLFTSCSHKIRHRNPHPA